MRRKKGQGRPQVKLDKRENCVYCGDLAECTEEHVVPECLYPDDQRPTRNEFAIVPACGKCNGRKSSDDSYMRDVLTVDIDCWGHPLAEKVQDKFYRSIWKDRSIFAREALRDPRPIPIFTPNNIFLGVHQSVPLDRRRVDRFLRRVVQGLYWERYGVRIPNHYEFGSIRIRPGRYQEAYVHQASLGPSETRVIGDRVFHAIFTRSTEDPLTSMWLMSFYQRIAFSVWAINPKYNRDTAS